MEAEANSEATN